MGDLRSFLWFGHGYEIHRLALRACAGGLLRFCAPQSRPIEARRRNQKSLRWVGCRRYGGVAVLSSQLDSLGLPHLSPSAWLRIVLLAQVFSASSYRTVPQLYSFARRRIGP